MPMMTRKQWQAYKKKHDLPDGLGGSISLGEVLQKYEKSKQTDADFKKLEKKVGDWAKAALKAKKGAHKKQANYIASLVPLEAAERESAERAEAAERGEVAAGKRNARLVDQVVASTTTLKGLFKELKAAPGVFEAKQGDELFGERERLEGLIGEAIDALREVGLLHGDLHTPTVKMSELRYFSGSADQYIRKAKAALKDVARALEEVESAS